jgi:hypothetical protein
VQSESYDTKRQRLHDRPRERRVSFWVPVISSSEDEYEQHQSLHADPDGSERDESAFGWVDYPTGLKNIQERRKDLEA